MYMHRSLAGTTGGVFDEGHHRLRTVDLEMYDEDDPILPGVGLRHVGAPTETSQRKGNGGGSTRTVPGLPQTSVGDILGRVYNLVISFFTNAYIRFVMDTNASPELFFFYLVVMVLMLMHYDMVKALILRLGDRGTRWNATLVAVLDFVTVTFVLIVFQYAPMLALQYWSRAGLSTTETVVFPIIALISVFAGYYYVSDMGSSSSNGAHADKAHCHHQQRERDIDEEAPRMIP